MTGRNPHAGAKPRTPPPKRKPGVHVRVGKWTCEVVGPPRLTMPAVLAAAGEQWSWDHASRCLRIRIEHVHDLLAALDERKVPTAVHGPVPQSELWSS